MRSLEGPRGSPRVTLSFDAVRPPRPTAVSPNTMSDNRFPAAIDMQGFVDSWLENATVYWDTAAGCLGLVSSARACRSTSSGTKSRIGLCSNLARALSTAAEICSGGRCPYLLVRRRSTSAIISSSLISATGTACVSEHQPSTRGQLCVTRRRLMLAARGTACGGRMPKWPRMLGWRRRGCSWGCCATRSPRYPTSSKRQTAMSIDEQSTATIGG